MLDGTVAAEYTALKEQYPNTLVGFELNGKVLRHAIVQVAN